MTEELKAVPGWRGSVPITVKLGPIALAQKHVRDQEEWIRDHGGTLEGYITKYGTSEDPFYGTLGGPAIYASDTLYLYLLTNQMRDEARRARRPHATER